MDAAVAGLGLAFLQGERRVSGKGRGRGRASAHIINTVEEALVDMPENLEDEALSRGFISKVKRGGVYEGEAEALPRAAVEVEVDV